MADGHREEHQHLHSSSPLQPPNPPVNELQLSSESCPATAAKTSIPGYMPQAKSKALFQSTEVHIPLSEYVALTTAKSAPASSNWSFTQGFVLGQISFCLVIIFFIRFFIFGPSPPPSRPQSNPIRPPQPPHLRKKQSALLRATTPQSISTILSKTYYNVNSHQPESLDWFNVLIAQTLAQFRDDARNDDALLNSLKKVLNGEKKPGFLDEIVVSEVALGDEFPIFSNCRIMPSDDDPGKLQARMDVDLTDVLTLGIETKLLLNWPTPLVAVMPVSLAVSILRFSGTLQIAFVPAGENAAAATTLAFSLLEDYKLDISVRSLLGSRSKLTDVPKIGQLVESRLYQWIDERCVEPRFQQIVLPSLWPRKKTTREQTREEGAPIMPTGPMDEGARRRRGTGGGV